MVKIKKSGSKDQKQKSEKSNVVPKKRKKKVRKYKNRINKKKLVHKYTIDIYHDIKYIYSK